MRARFLVALLVLIPSAATAAEPLKSFPPATYGKGELRYVDDVPVLMVRGKPAEMGEQFGKLAVENAPDLMGLHDRFIKESGEEKRYPLLALLAGRLKKNFPPNVAAEVEAAARAAGKEESLLLFANTIADLSSGMGCSTVVVEPERSATGRPLFGRNFDWLATRGINEHTLVVVYKGEGKRAFATVTVSPICGVISGMNDAGLAVTINEIHIKKSKDNSKFNWNGTPLLFCFRRVLEECATVAEAEKLLRAMPRTTTCCLTLCDKNGGAVFEITPDNLEVRSADNGVCCCTNHFRSDKLCVGAKCWRYERLAPLLEKGGDKLTVKDVFGKLDEVSQGKNTIESMVFEPAERVLHLAYGEGPATRLRRHDIDLGKLFDAK